MASLGFLSIVSVVLAWFGWHVAARAGFSPFWGLTALVPPLGILALWYLAFAPWPGGSARVADGTAGGMAGGPNAAGFRFSTNARRDRQTHDGDASM